MTELPELEQLLPLVSEQLKFAKERIPGVPVWLV